MSKSSSQTLKNHARLDPLFHFVLAPVFSANIIVAITYAVHHDFCFLSVWWIVVAIAAFLALFKVRLYPLKVQDRVIRLEERLRLQALAPPAWHPEIYRLTEAQLVALRFASDDEVAGLARQAVEENLTNKQIKERIKNWRGDYWRV